MIEEFINLNCALCHAHVINNVSPPLNFCGMGWGEAIYKVKTKNFVL